MKQIINFETKEGGCIVDYRQSREGLLVSIHPPIKAPDRVWREVYEVKEGNLVLK